MNELERRTLLGAAGMLHGGAAVQRCNFLATGGPTGATAIQLEGNMNTVHDCIVNGALPRNGPQGRTTYGVRIIGNGSSIAGNRICAIPAVAGPACAWTAPAATATTPCRATPSRSASSAAPTAAETSRSSKT